MSAIIWEYPCLSREVFSGKWKTDRISSAVLPRAPSYVTARADEMENGEKKILSPAYFGSFASGEYRSNANRLFASITLFPRSEVELLAFGCTNFVPVHPAKTILMTTSEAKVQMPIVFNSMAERLSACWLNLALGAVFFEVTVFQQTEVHRHFYGSFLHLLVKCLDFSLLFALTAVTAFLASRCTTNNFFNWVSSSQL